MERDLWTKLWKQSSDYTNCEESLVIKTDSAYQKFGL